ncbi:hypothetical protein N7381_09600 [Pseudomonas asiatica]|uniref:hypothetical protein n=1 Tax=Pseudomonas asiatica TaxID=2219225 RepID=UPI0024480362|nr:hypothetical protein [Pseudomonas asiatica]MDH0133499.1 hypothetical protein [Pseudomonas asiatica]
MSAVPVSVIEGALNSFCMPVAEASSRTFYSGQYTTQCHAGSAREVHGAAAMNHRVAYIGGCAEALSKSVAMHFARDMYELQATFVVGSGFHEAKHVVKNSDLIPLFYPSMSLLGSLDAGSSTTDNVELQAKLLISTMKTFLHEVSRRKALDYMYEILEDAYSQADLGLINEMLYWAAQLLVGESIAVSFLRATSRVRQRSVYWSHYCQVVKKSFEGNPEAEKTLRGLA